MAHLKTIKATFHYSNKNDNGYFGLTKVTFGSGGTGFIIDTNGEFGIYYKTQWAVGIVDENENLDKFFLKKLK